MYNLYNLYTVHGVQYIVKSIFYAQINKFNVHTLMSSYVFMDQRMKRLIGEQNPFLICLGSGFGKFLSQMLALAPVLISGCESDY